MKFLNPIKKVEKELLEDGCIRYTLLFKWWVRSPSKKLELSEKYMKEIKNEI
jgi:hypothetical protein